MKRWIACLTLFGLLAAPSQMLAAPSADLLRVYAGRGDLQQVFPAPSYRAVQGSAAGFLIDLEDWARQYGWREVGALDEYAPAVKPITFKRGGAKVPIVKAKKYIVIDNASGAIIAAQDAQDPWPIASITKLVTAKVALDAGLDFYGTGTVETVDDVGGGKLYVNGGTRFTVRDLFYATLVGSANNAANAIARMTGLERAEFIARMNRYAEGLNLSHTHFVDPTGIELENIATAREVAYFAMKIFENETVRRASGTSGINIKALNDAAYVRSIKSTNELLYAPTYNDVYVTAGKTGYLDESGWNLVVRMHPMGKSFDQSVTIVIFGAASRRKSFDDAHTLARWAWNNFDWKR